MAWTHTFTQGHAAWHAPAHTFGGWPMGKGGINMHDSKDWVTENAYAYHAHEKMDTPRDRGQAQSPLLRVFAGPTASAGRVAPATRAAAVRTNEA
ncbi:MAG: hypothetical protein WDW38_010042 [Sanguina aurantia]